MAAQRKQRFGILNYAGEQVERITYIFVSRIVYNCVASNNLSDYIPPHECRAAKSSSGEYTSRLRPTSAKYSSPAPNHTAQPYTPKR